MAAALETMQDVAKYINEVKRDNETLQLIEEIQNSIVDLQMVRLNDPYHEENLNELFDLYKRRKMGCY